MSETESRAETFLACAAIGVSVLFLVEGSKLKPGVFEPIGPGAVPMGVAAFTIVLSLLVLIGRWRSRQTAFTPRGRVETVPAAALENWQLLLFAIVCTLAYVGVLHTGMARYGYATVVYLLVTFLLVADHKRQALPWSVGLALFFGLGLDYVFRYLLVADLP